MDTSIRLVIPASSAWVVLARTAASACCARLDFDVERLEDVRLAVDEVVALLVDHAVPGTDVACTFAPHDDGHLDITVSAETDAGALPPTDTFAWAVLTALVDDITATVDAQRTTVVLRTSRTASSVGA